MALSDEFINSLEIDTAQADAQERRTAACQPPVLTGGLPVNLDKVSDLVNLLNLKDSVDYDLYIQPLKICTGLNEFSINFDWWQGSVFVPSNDMDIQDQDLAFLSLLDQELLTIFDPKPVFSRPAKAHNYYKSSNIWRDSDSEKTSNRIAQCFWGGENQGYNLLASGFYTPSVVPLFQSLGAIPSRIDVALDVFFPYFETFFDDVVECAKDFALEHGLLTSTAGCWVTPNNKGRTFYLGSRESTLQCVIYQKGLQMHNDSDFAPAMPNWTRIEFRFMPDEKNQRKNFTQLTPFQCLESGWAPKFLKSLGFDISQSRSLTPPKKCTSFDRSKNALLSQYGNTFRTWLENSTPEQFLSELLHKLQVFEKVDKNLIDTFLSKK